MLCPLTKPISTSSLQDLVIQHHLITVIPSFIHLTISPRLHSMTHIYIELSSNKEQWGNDAFIDISCSFLYGCTHIQFQPLLYQPWHYRRSILHIVMTKHKNINQTLIAILIKQIAHLATKHHLFAQFHLYLTFIDFQSSTSTREI